MEAGEMNDEANMLQIALAEVQAENKRLRDMIVRFCEANVQAADTWKRREDIAPLFVVAEEVEAAVRKGGGE